MLYKCILIIVKIPENTFQKVMGVIVDGKGSGRKLFFNGKFVETHENLAKRLRICVFYFVRAL
jgi:hypothetical protein